MNIELIKNDIFVISDDFLSETLNIIENNYVFIDENQLVESKENYFFLFHFLTNTINHFLNLDLSFAHKTLKKLHKDINTLHILYKTQKREALNIEKVFNKNIFSKIPLFKEMEQELNYFKNLSNLEDQETRKLIQEQYKALKIIYFQCFKEEYNEQMRYILESLKNIINTKLYYLDSMLWDGVNKSSLIKRTFKNIPKEKYMTSKSYIQYRLDVDLPYTNDYKYLQDCLRTYK